MVNRQVILQNLSDALKSYVEMYRKGNQKQIGILRPEIYSHFQVVCPRLLKPPPRKPIKLLEYCQEIMISLQNISVNVHLKERGRCGSLMCPKTVQNTKLMTLKSFNLKHLQKIKFNSYCNATRKCKQKNCKFKFDRMHMHTPTIAKCFVVLG